MSNTYINEYLDYATCGEDTVDYTSFSQAIIISETGLQGYSAYDVAVQAGFVGTIEQWTAALNMPPGGVFGQVLVKQSSTDYDVAWTYIPLPNLDLTSSPQSGLMMSLGLF